MNIFTYIAVIMTILGAALIGGVFFAFSNFIMKAFSRLPSSEGMAAMQSINVVVLNPGFLGVFTGTAIISVLISIIAIGGWGTPSAPYFLAGALLYIVGTFLVTGMGNVPLNKQLASMNPAAPAAGHFWQHYLERWTQLNTLRTVCAFAAAVMLTIGLVKS